MATQRGGRGIATLACPRGERRSIFRCVQIVAKEGDRLVDVLQITAGFGFEREHDFAACPLCNLDQCCDVPRHVVRHYPRNSVPIGERFEGAGNGRDGTDDIGRQQRGQYLRDAIGIMEPFRHAPIGLVNVLLDRAAMKRAIRKGVDGEDVQSMIGEKAAELGEGGGGTQLLGGDARQAQPKSHRPLRRHLDLDLWNMGGEARSHFAPGLARMDVGAVGEVYVAGKVIEPHGGYLSRALTADLVRVRSHWIDW